MTETGITFEPFPKIARLNREIVITEKIDGTNAQVIISDDGSLIAAASRTRLLTPENDNFGFARWVEENKAELMKLGPGRHFGEWWGGKIQRGYGVQDRRFSLFNTHRWSDPETRPACCLVVPVLYQGLYSDAMSKVALAKLQTEGSVAAPGFPKPEGIVIFHTASNALFKVTCEGDESPKTKPAAGA